MYHASDLIKLMNHTYAMYLKLATACLNANSSDTESIHAVDVFTKTHKSLITEESCKRTLSTTVDLCSVPVSHSNMGYTIFLALLMLVIFGTNLFFCWSVYHSKALLRKPSHRFILSLAISDLMIAAVIMPIIIDSTLHNRLFCSSLPFCHLAFFADHLIVLSSILILLAIGIDRYIAVSHPYRYQDLMTVKRSTIIIVSIWVSSFLFGLNSNMDWTTMTFRGVEITKDQVCLTRNPKFTAFVILSCLFIPLIVMGYIYYKILRVTLHHSMPIATIGMLVDIENLETASASTTSEQRPSIPSLSIVAAPKKNRVNVSCFSSAKLKAIRVTVIVYGSFVLCWLPGNIITFINLLWPGSIILDPWQYHLLNEFLPLSNAAMNVFIYAMMNDDCRRAMQKRLCCKAVHRRIERKRLEKERLRRASEKSLAITIRSTAL